MNYIITNKEYDSYWKHGSVCEDYSALDIPILIMGGWHDGYSDAAIRLVQNLPNARLIMGPWSHMWPDSDPPGAKVIHCHWP